MSSFELSEEDKILDTLIMTSKKYDDTDFLPIRQSLYTDPAQIPEYDGDIFHQIVWCRPNTLTDLPTYFLGPSTSGLGCIQGFLPDHTFIGTLMAISVYPGRDLLENVIASRPTDFINYGIYTCRFYVEGEWVEVITDTNLPCIRDENTGNCHLIYSHAIDSSEMWISMIEKAYAKAVGCYEAIQKVKIQEALLHLTGGSVKTISIREYLKNNTIQILYNYYDDLLHHDTLVLLVSNTMKSNKMKKATSTMMNFDINSDTIATTTTTNSNNNNDNNNNNNNNTSSGTALANPETDNSNENENENGNNVNSRSTDNLDILSSAIDDTTMNNTTTANDMFEDSRIYTLITCRQYDDIQLILLYSPWNNNKVWTGPWSNTSSEWSQYPHILNQIESDPFIPWSKKRPKGYFWIPISYISKYFSLTYSCKLFIPEKFKFYCIKDEWSEPTAGGRINLIRNKGDIVRDAAASRVHAQQKSLPAVVIDGEVSWFINPQYRILTAKPCIVTFSLAPTSGSEDSQTQNMQLTLLSQPTTTYMASQARVFESCLVDMVAMSKNDVYNRGQEIGIWDITLDPNKVYHLIPNLLRHGVEGSFIIRIFATDSLIVEQVKPLERKVIHGNWTRSNDLDTTGGPPNLKKDNNIKINPKWCQNPQYYIELLNSHTKEDFYLKIVLKRIEKDSTTTTTSNSKNNTISKVSNKLGPLSSPGLGGLSSPGIQPATPHDAKVIENTLGLIVCKASCLYDDSLDIMSTNNTKRNKNQPKENIFGEVIESKASSLIKKSPDKPLTSADIPTPLPTTDLESKTPTNYTARSNYINSSRIDSYRGSGMPSTIRTYRSNMNSGNTSEIQTSSNYKVTLQPIKTNEPTSIYDSNTNTTTSAANSTTTTKYHIIKRMTILENEHFYMESTCNSKMETTLFMPKLPKSWMPHGLILIPYLNEKNIKAHYDIEIYSNENIKISHIPENHSRSIACEWKQHQAGGSHLLPSWKKNPKFQLKIRSSSRNLSSHIRISIQRFGSKWKSLCKQDGIGCMIGFYIFKNNKNNELIQLYESNFVPVDEISTEDGFCLDSLENDEMYIIMPTTYNADKYGSFILNIMCERDFTLKLEK